MKIPFYRIFAAGMLCGLLCLGAARGATVHKVDDSIVTGDVVSLADGKLVVEAKSAPKAKPDRVTIPLSDIVQIVWREPPPPVPVPSANPNNDDNSDDSGGGFWSTLFGSHRSTVDSNDSPPAPPPPTSRPSATRPAGSIRWQIQLTGGDSLHGYIDKWSDRELAISLDSPAGQSIDLPAEQLAELWSGTDAEQASARALAADTSATDVVFVRKDADVIPLKGVALGIAGDALRFRYGDDDRKIALTRIVGVIMSQGGRKMPAGIFRQSISLHGGDTLIGKWTMLAKGSATLQTNWGQAVHVALSDVDRIDFLDGRVVYVSDLKPAKVEQVPFFGRVIPFRLDCGLDGGPLKLSDGTYPRGIAVHSRCVLEYAIAGKFQRFQTKLGFEQPLGQIGRAAIRVLADGKPLYANPDARGQDKPIAIDCDVTGAQTLTLEVDFGKDQDAGGRVIWANARLLREMPAE